MVGTVFLDVAARGGRWQALLAPIKRVPYRRVLGYTYLGYLANNVLPARLGELVRSHALGEGRGASAPRRCSARSSSSAIVDTVIVVALAAIAVVVLGVGGIDLDRRDPGRRVRRPARRRSDRGDREPPTPRRRPRHGAWPSASRGSSTWPGASGTGWPWSAGRGCSRRRCSSAPSAWTVSILTFMARRAGGRDRPDRPPGGAPVERCRARDDRAVGPGYVGTFELTAVGDRVALRRRTPMRRSPWRCWSTR